MSAGLLGDRRRPADIYTRWVVWNGGGFKTETREGTVENSAWKNGANASQGGGWDAGPLKQREQVGFKTETWGQKRQEGPDR